MDSDRITSVSLFYFVEFSDTISPKRMLYVSILLCRVGHNLYFNMMKKNVTKMA